MKMIIGGTCQGKVAYASQKYGIKPEEWKDGGQCREEELYTAKGVYNFHQWIRKTMKAGENISQISEKISEKNPELILVTDEVGNGIVPMEREEREWREACGRICTKLAASSEEVIRVCCGIGQKIK